MDDSELASDDTAEVATLSGSEVVELNVLEVNTTSEVASDGEAARAANGGRVSALDGAGGVVAFSGGGLVVPNDIVVAVSNSGSAAADSFIVAALALVSGGSIV